MFSLEFYIIINFIIFFSNCFAIDYIEEMSKNPESKWTKFWNLFSNVENEYNNKISFYPFIKPVSFYKTCKIILLKEFEVFKNTQLLKLLSPITLKNNKQVIPVFIKDSLFYISIEQVSELREYDILDTTDCKYDLKNMLNHLISTDTSPYRVTLINPCDLDEETITLTKIKNGEFEITQYNKEDNITI